MCYIKKKKEKRALQKKVEFLAADISLHAKNGRALFTSKFMQFSFQ